MFKAEALSDIKRPSWIRNEECDSGDVVWAIENAQMVIILRQSQSEVGNGPMEFTGDVYVNRSREVKIK